METTKKAAQTLALAFISFLVLSACSSQDEALSIADKDMERIDIRIEGDIALDDYRLNLQSDPATDLVHYVYYGHNAENFDFVIALADGHDLIIELYDAQRLDPWQQVDLPYNIYPGQDLEDKLYYTRIKLRNSEGQIAYSTNSTTGIPPAVYLDVFRITGNDGEQIQCRIQEMVLYKSNDTDRRITINGTFVGVFDIDIS